MFHPVAGSNEGWYGWVVWRFSWFNSCWRPGSPSQTCSRTSQETSCAWIHVEVGSQCQPILTPYIASLHVWPNISHLCNFLVIIFCTCNKRTYCMLILFKINMDHSFLLFPFCAFTFSRIIQVLKLIYAICSNIVNLSYIRDELHLLRGSCSSYFIHMNK